MLPAGWSYKRRPQPTASETAKFVVEVPRDAEYTRPYYHRDSSEQPLYTVDEPDLAALPITPPPVQVKVTCRFPQGSVEFMQLVEADSSRRRRGSPTPARGGAGGIGHH